MTDFFSDINRGGEFWDDLTSQKYILLVSDIIENCYNKMQLTAWKVNYYYYDVLTFPPPINLTNIYNREKLSEDT